MKQRWKVIAGFIALCVLIALSTWAYGFLSKRYKPLDQANDKADTEETDSLEMDEEDSGKQKKIEAVDFTMVDDQGEEVKLSDFFGKPIVVNFWASWCPPCKSEMPEFDKVWNEVGEEVTFLMINMTDGQRETKETAKKYLSTKEFTFPVYFDTKQEAAYIYGISSLPTTMYIDKDGYLVDAAIGMVTEDDLRKNIERLMTENNMDDVSDGEIPESAEYHKITAKEAYGRMKESRDYVLLDVRTEEEFAEKRIEGAVLIPDYELEARALEELPDKDSVIFVYCRSGRRSESAAKKLVENGYQNVYDFGGINDWPYDTVSSD